MAILNETICENSDVVDDRAKLNFKTIETKSVFV